MLYAGKEGGRGRRRGQKRGDAARHNVSRREEEGDAITECHAPQVRFDHIVPRCGRREGGGERECAGLPRNNDRSRAAHLGVAGVNRLVGIVVDEEADVGEVARGQAVDGTQAEHDRSDAHLFARGRHVKGIDDRIGEIHARKVDLVQRLPPRVFGTQCAPLDGDVLRIASVEGLIKDAVLQYPESGERRSRGAETHEVHSGEREDFACEEIGADGNKENGTAAFVRNRI